MLDVAMCIRTEHNWWLVGLAAAVCVLGSLATFYLYSKTPPFPRRQRWHWLALTGVVAGTTIWTTHFVAMIGFQTALPTAYGGRETALSLAAAVVSTLAGFWLASADGGERPSRPKALAGGLVVGLGVALMHYLGMSGFHTPARVRWEPAMVDASIVLGAVFGALALGVAGPGASWRRRAAGAGLLSLAICGMHFTGMAALRLTPDSAVFVPPQALDVDVMASIAVGGAALIIVAAVGGVALDAASRNGNLRRLREALDVIPDGLAFYDAYDRLVAWNAQYEDLCRECGVSPVAGMPFSQLLHSSLVHGVYPDARGREVEWLSERNAMRRGELPSLTQRTAGGRWLRVTDRRTADGGSVSVSVDITELKTAEMAMKESRDRAEEYARRAEEAEAVAGLGHWRLEVATGAVSWSPQLYRIFGVEPGEPLTLEQTLAMTHPDDSAASRERILRQRRTGDVEGEFVVRIIRPDGQVRHLSSKSTVQRDASGAITSVVGVMVDVTEQKVLEGKLRHAQAEAETAAQVKAEFLANMSHELRTPLTSIIGFTGLAALQPDLTDQTRGFLGRVRDASQALLTTVNDILDFSKLEAGQVTIHPQPVSIPELCRKTLGMLAPQAGGKALSLTYDGDPEADLVVAVDPDRIRQLLLNLVGNAVKFTPQGGVTLKTRYDEAAGRLRVEVIDTGPGIAPDKRALLFQRFSQIDGSLTQAGGTGLGLAICKGLVEAMGGEIGADAAPDGGSRFWFSIPAPRAALEAPAPEAPPALGRPGLRVLLAEDHPANRLIARLYLGSIGAVLTEAEDGAEAVRLAAAEPFDVLLMDVRMPNLDGPGALRRIREEGGPNARTPALAFTADAGDARLTAQLLATGFQGVVPKPLDSGVLVAAVAKATAPLAEPEPA